MGFFFTNEASGGGGGVVQRTPAHHLKGSEDSLEVVVPIEAEILVDGGVAVFQYFGCGDEIRYFADPRAELKRNGAFGRG